MTTTNDSSKNLTSKMVSDFDQATAVHASIATMVAAYYQSLLMNGVPTELAAVLAKDMNAICWNRQSILGRIKTQNKRVT